MRKWLAILLLLLEPLSGQCQSDTLKHYARRKAFVAAGNAVAYSAAMYGMYNLWYKDYPFTRFHFHNDNADWHQMDKVGHLYSCYYEGVVGIDQMKWAGFSRKQAILVGGSYGFLIQTGVEVFDGFSQEWGASWGDVAANVAGSALVIGQALAWDEQRIWMKLSFSPTRFPEIRPELLGRSDIEQLFKDYNGQTYWLSANIKSFLLPATRFPSWLNISVGYGIDGLVGGADNLFIRDGATYDYQHIPRSRQWYLAPDIDLTRIPVKNKALKFSFRLLNCLKFPLPGLAYQGNGGDISFKFIQF